MPGAQRRRLGAAGYAMLLRADFAVFAQRAFNELYPRARFRMNWHFEVIAARLAAVQDGRIRRLLINLPPRHLKSLLASVAFPAWFLGHRPNRRNNSASVFHRILTVFGTFSRNGAHSFALFRMASSE